MELLISFVCIVLGLVFGWSVASQILAFTSLIGLPFAMLCIPVGVTNQRQILFALLGFCTILFIISAWLGHALK